jgi:hypothetical protein
MARALAIVTALALVGLAARPALAKKRHEDTAADRLEKSEDKVEGGQHWRIKTAEGSVHVWVPPGYDRASAGTVVYVHGYYTDADGAWADYKLARQFKASHQNALFVVPDAPAGNDQDVKWAALTDLRKALAKANIRIPDGPTIVMGHSGAFRTVMKWVDHHAIEQIILLDALYGGEKQFDDYIANGKRADQHKLIVVGSDTAASSSSFAKKYPFAVARDAMPDGKFSKRERRAKLLYIRSQFGHMEIVTSGKVIPKLLQLTHLRAVGAKDKEPSATSGASVTIPAPPVPLPMVPMPVIKIAPALSSTSSSK